jgi:hypothetical protein
MNQETITLPLGDLLRHATPEALTRELLARITIPAALESKAVPKIGAPWPGGGIYAGTVRGENGAPDYHLIVHGEDRGDINYDNASAWAQQLAVDENLDWSLPRRAEQAVMFGNVPEVFEKTYYWSCEQYAGEPSWAWFQHFHYGPQSTTHKDRTLRARAVRRLAIQ